MRILHIVHQYAPDHVGGTELYTETLARYQAQNGHSVAVFYPSDRSEADARPLPDEQNSVRIYSVPLGVRSRRQLFQDTFRQREVDKAFTAVLTAEKPDIVHIQHLMGLPFSLVQQLIRSKIPYIITLHDYWYGCANAQLITNTDHALCAGPDRWFVNCGQCAAARGGTKGGAALAPLMALRNHKLRHILQQAYTVIAPTPFVRQIYQEMGLSSRHFQLIQHGIQAPLEKIAEIKAQRAQQPKPKRPGLRIGFIGSVAWQKGVHVLVTAVNQLPTENVSLTIYGGLTAFPDYVAELRPAAVHPGIHFAGRVNRDDLWAAMANLDVIVLPTLWYEASPLTIQEAFAVGVPLVASRIGAMPDKIRDGVDGLLFPPGDAAALQHILFDLWQNPPKLAQLQAGIDPIYTMAQQVKVILDVYTSALNRPR